MKFIPHKAKPKYSFKFFRPAPTAPERVMHTRYFRENFAAEELPGPGLSKKAVYLLPKGIVVMHSQLSKPKLIKKEIQRAFGKGITSTAPASKKHHNGKYNGYSEYHKVKTTKKRK